MNSVVAIVRSPIEGIYVVREDTRYWMVNDEGVAYFTGLLPPEFNGLLALGQRTLADKSEE